MVFVSNDKTAVVVKPGKQALDFPAALVASESASILGAPPATAAVRSDQLYAAFFAEPTVGFVAVVGFVAYQARWRLFGDRLVEGAVNKGDFVGRSTCHVNGERKTMSVCDCHDLGALAASGFPHAKPPFFAPLKEPSMKASERSSSPRSVRSTASSSRIRFITSARTHCWNRRWQVWYGGYRSGRSFHGAPVRSTHRMPLRTSRLSRQGRPRPSARRRGTGISGSRIAHCSFVRSMYHTVLDPAIRKLLTFMR